MPSSLVESERLLLSPYSASDLDALYAIQSDPRVGRYTDTPPDSAEAALRFEAAEAQRAIWGAAPWVARKPTESEVVGWGGLLIDTLDPGWGVEVAYFVAPRFWGQGYASEIARRAVRFGFESLGLNQLAAMAMPENSASNGVLEKAGFEVVGYIEDMQRNHFLLSRESWQRRAV